MSPSVTVNLPDADRDALNQYLEHLAEQMAEKEPCLYTGGFKDGIRVMKFIRNLSESSPEKEHSL